MRRREGSRGALSGRARPDAGAAALCTRARRPHGGQMRRGAAGARPGGVDGLEVAAVALDGRQAQEEDARVGAVTLLGRVLHLPVRAVVVQVHALLEHDLVRAQRPLPPRRRPHQRSPRTHTGGIWLQYNTTGGGDAGGWMADASRCAAMPGLQTATFHSSICVPAWSGKSPCLGAAAVARAAGRAAGVRRASRLWAAAPQAPRRARRPGRRRRAQEHSDQCRA